MKNKVTILLIVLIAVFVAGLVVILNKLNDAKNYSKYETSFAFVDLSTDGTSITDYPIQLEIFVIYQADKIITDVNNNVANRTGTFYSLLDEAENGESIGIISRYGTDNQNYTVDIFHKNFGGGGLLIVNSTFVNGKENKAPAATHRVLESAEEYYNSTVITDFQEIADREFYGTAYFKLISSSGRTGVKVDSAIFTDYGVAIKNERDATRTYISNSKRSTAIIFAPSFYAEELALKTIAIAHSIDDVFDLTPFEY